MIFLLPPSETKEPGGEKPSKVLSFNQLDSTRQLLQLALVELCKTPRLAAKALKLGPKQLGELQVNQELVSPRCLPAVDRYTGTLYEALTLGGFSAVMRERAKGHVYVQSSLFGMISAVDDIPNYRLSAGSKIPGINLKSLWQLAHADIWSNFSKQVVIDLRSNSYAQLAPVPDTISSYTVEVVLEDSEGNRRALNHFNKKAKGQFVRAALLAKTQPKTVSDLKLVAKKANLRLEISGKKLLLITSE
jgi:cytoplasmic iron level regulating protein YaaA (DUF328/UPF0246 family)